MTPAANQTSIQPPPAPPSRACPRCRADLAIIRRQLRRAEAVTAFLCPSVTCGYKLIVPE